MKRLQFILMALLCSASLFAQKRHALIIGIDTYKPDSKVQTQVMAQGDGPNRAGWSNLDGCVNDAKSIKELMMAKFGFRNEEFRELYNGEATRDRIIAELEGLIKVAKKGDIVLIYYAGHGSQVKNSLSKEMDKKDESMVPADSYKGAKDIRDKELAALFNKLVEKGVTLTVIYDSCHSGSIGRGPLAGDPPKTRYLPEDPSDVADPTEAPEPEKNGALIISAAQDYEFAKEARDANGNPHGAFTLAFLTAMQSLPATVSVKDLFASIRANMKYSNQSQEPVLAGNEVRQNATLFGQDRGSLPKATLVAVIDKRGDEIEMQGGYAVGIKPGTRLRRIDGKDTFLIEISSMKGVNRCIGNATKGNPAKIKAGDLFEISNWVADAVASLKVYIPRTDLTMEQVAAKAKEMDALKASFGQWVSDPTEGASHTLLLEQNKWVLVGPDFSRTDMGVSPNVASLSGLSRGEQRSVFMSLPAMANVYNGLVTFFQENNSVEITASANDAHYILVGRYHEGKLEYALVAPMMVKSDINSGGLAMPVRTDFFDAADSKKLMENLEDMALRLAKIRSWLTLEGPEDDGSYPFGLQFENLKTKARISGGKVKKGDQFQLVFVTDPNGKDRFSGYRRYVYVFNIDNNGKMQLMYPGSNVENRLPRNPDGVLENETILPRTKFELDVAGVDTYILISTDEPIADLNVFNQDAVRTRGAAGGGLTDILRNTGTNTRGKMMSEPTWGIQKYTLSSKE